MPKFNWEVVRKSIKEIGLSGTAIRGCGWIVSRYSEDSILYRRMKRRYKKYMNGYSERRLTDLKSGIVNRVIASPIWVCWFQGIENAPELVKACYESLLNNANGHNVIVLTEKNIRDYVSFPEYIWEKYQSGIIPRPQFSDMLRVAVLFNWGGLWVDSTMYFTSAIPEWLWHQEMFVFKFHDRRTKQVCSSQFIYARPGNAILGKTLDAMFFFWRTKKKMISYYQFQYFVSLAVREYQENFKIFSEIPSFFSEQNHILQNEMFDEFSKERWDSIKKFSFVHKLSYKHLKTKENGRKNTYYSLIVERNSCVK